MSEKVLFVDDDANILAGYQRALRKQFRIEIAIGAEAALKIIERQGPYAVVVSDMYMPGMNGVHFLAKVKEIAPDTVRIMLTGNPDLRTAIEAVHHGHIFRFLTKPCPPESLAMALEAGIEQYRLITAERDLLEKTLSGSVRMLMEILAMVDPHLFGRAQTLRGYVRSLAQTLQVGEIWKLELAATLAQVGLVTIPPVVVLKARAGHPLSEAEQEMLERVPEISHNLLINIPRLEPVARIVLYQNKHFDGSGFPRDNVSGYDIPLGARMLKVLSDMRDLEENSVSRRRAFEVMRKREGWYDPRVLEAAVVTFVSPAEAQQQTDVPAIAVSVRGLRIGHVLASDVYTADGKLLISAGHRVSEALLERIRNFAEVTGIREPLYVEMRQGGGLVQAA
ncbi:MAG: response regulator receiver modulated metal-depenent phosphohydrolase [Armatimonadota bacterium]|nr:MAG: response regulator receiver modulated metal-depenent phosphohydrolase [Armatimonadota bacterium]